MLGENPQLGRAHGEDAARKRSREEAVAGLRDAEAAALPKMSKLSPEPESAKKAGGPHARAGGCADVGAACNPSEVQISQQLEPKIESEMDSGPAGAPATPPTPRGTPPTPTLRETTPPTPLDRLSSHPQSEPMCAENSAHSQGSGTSAGVIGIEVCENVSLSLPSLHASLGQSEQEAHHPAHCGEGAPRGPARYGGGASQEKEEDFLRTLGGAPRDELPQASNRSIRPFASEAASRSASALQGCLLSHGEDYVSIGECREASNAVANADHATEVDEMEGDTDYATGRHALPASQEQAGLKSNVSDEELEKAGDLLPSPGRGNGVGAPEIARGTLFPPHAADGNCGHVRSKRASKKPDCLSKSPSAHSILACNNRPLKFIRGSVGGLVLKAAESDKDEIKKGGTESTCRGALGPKGSRAVVASTHSPGEKVGRGESAPSSECTVAEALNRLEAIDLKQSRITYKWDCSSTYSGRLGNRIKSERSKKKTLKARGCSQDVWYNVSWDDNSRNQIQLNNSTCIVAACEEQQEALRVHEPGFWCIDQESLLSSFHAQLQKESRGPLAGADATGCRKRKGLGRTKQHLSKRSGPMPSQHTSSGESPLPVTEEGSLMSASTRSGEACEGEAVKGNGKESEAPVKAEQPKEEQPKEEQPKEEQPGEEQPGEEQPKEEQPKAEQLKEEQQKKEQSREEQPPDQARRAAEKTHVEFPARYTNAWQGVEEMDTDCVSRLVSAVPFASMASKVDPPDCNPLQPRAWEGTESLQGRVVQGRKDHGGRKDLSRNGGRKIKMNRRMKRSAVLSSARTAPNPGFVDVCGHHIAEADLVAGVERFGGFQTVTAKKLWS